MAVCVYRHAVVLLLSACCRAAKPMGDQDSLAFVSSAPVHACLFSGRSLFDSALGLNVSWSNSHRPGGG